MTSNVALRTVRVNESRSDICVYHLMTSHKMCVKLHPTQKECKFLFSNLGKGATVQLLGRGGGSWMFKTEQIIHFTSCLQYFLY